MADESSSTPSPRGRTDDLESRLREELSPRFEILRRLGETSRARAFLAREEGLDRLVTVKVLEAGGSEDDTAERRFQREARAVAALSHPAVVQLHRFGRLGDGTPYMVMQHVKGPTLRDRLAAEGPLPVDECRKILADVASALAAAHRQGIVHREVSPDNVLWEEATGRALLADFGIAAILASGEKAPERLTRTGEVVGDPRYLSPEYLEDGEVTDRSDVYGLALLGYEILSGEGPYRGTSNVEMIRAHVEGEPRSLRELRPDADADVADLLRRCLAREPNRRPSAERVARLLDSAGEPAAPSTPGDGPEPGTLERVFRRRLPQFVVVAGASGWVLLQIVDQLVQQGLLPRVVYALTLNLVGFGLVATGIVAWFHGEKGAQDVRPTEVWLLVLVAVGWIAASVLIVVG